MEKLNFNIYNLIIFSGIIQGFIFVLIVIFNKKFKSRTNNFIALTVLALSLSNLQYWLIDVDIMKLYFNSFDLRIPFDLLIAPMFYYFVVNYLKIKLLSFFKNLFISLFLISLFLNILISYGNSFNEISLKVINIALDVFSLVLNLALITIIILKVISYEKKNKVYNIDNVKAETKWLKKLLYLGFFMCILWVLVIILQAKFNFGLNAYYPIWICISLLVYFISYLGIINSNINMDRQKIRSIILDKQIKSPEKKQNIKSSNKLFSSILKWIEDEKLYLNPELSLKMVANQFNISSGYISQLINKNSDSNFSDFINKLRIEESMKMLKDESYSNYTITAIGLESGFNSKTSFYDAFKKFTNKTPTEFKKDVRNM